MANQASGMFRHDLEMESERLEQARNAIFRVGDSISCSHQGPAQFADMQHCSLLSNELAQLICALPVLLEHGGTRQIALNHGGPQPAALSRGKNLVLMGRITKMWSDRRARYRTK